MKRPTESQPRMVKFPLWCAVAASLAFCVPVSSSAQEMSPEEHASHHPGNADASSDAKPAESPAKSATSDGSDSGGSGSGGMMGGGMGGMMEKMGAPPPRELYPTLMSFPDVPPEEKREILDSADQRMQEAVGMLSTGLERLASAAETKDYAAMQDATEKMHEALSWLDSSVAAQRAIEKGQPPERVAMQWFKNEMNLHTPLVVETRGRFLGSTPFHLFSMVLLVLFALAMLVLYFFKMRRAAALFGRIEGGKGKNPPGSAPPIAD